MLHPFKHCFDKFISSIELGLQDMSNPPVTESNSSPEVKYNGEIQVKVSKTLHEKLARAAEREGVDLSQYIATLLSEQNAFSSMDKAVNDVQQKLNELNRQLRLNEASASDRRDRRVTYDTRYIEDIASGLND